jgi:hypothetical protein
MPLARQAGLVAMGLVIVVMLQNVPQDLTSYYAHETTTLYDNTKRSKRNSNDWDGGDDDTTAHDAGDATNKARVGDDAAIASQPVRRNATAVTSAPPDPSTQTEPAIVTEAFPSSGGIPWWDPLARDLSVVYAKANHSQWCNKLGKIAPVGWAKRRGPYEGLIYLKTPKAASSTGAGVTLQIAHNVAQRRFHNNATTTITTAILPCQAFYSHPFAFHYTHAQKHPQSLLWTTVRQPASLVLSLIFHFAVSRKGLVPTDENVMAKLDSFRNMQVKYTKSLTRDGAVHISMYDFLAVTDRMDESLVVMKLLWGLYDEDVLVLPSHIAGGYEARRGQANCSLTAKAFRTPAVDKYIQEEFQKENMDYVYYAAANYSLDKTIDVLGREKVEAEVERHRALQKLVNSQCASEAFFPCSTDGRVQRTETRQSCYYQDSGCGYACVNRVVAAHRRGTLSHPVPTG